MKLSPDEDDRFWRDSEKPHWFRFANPLRYVVFLVILIAVLIGLWYLIAPRRQWYNKVNLTLIQADEAPYKIKAKDDGVASVKHQDKLIYGRIRANPNEPVVEHILPDPEAPLPEIKEEGTSLKMVEQYLPDDIDPDKNNVESIQEELEKNVITSIEDLIDDFSKENKESEKKNITGNIFIQLGSLRSYDMAEVEWERILKMHPYILQGRAPVIQKIDLGADQGIYYRLRTGPFDNREKASQVCAQLNEQKVQCVVVP